ncbi:MAG: HEPN domain-containing protein [Eubacteriales bacterium]|nr:HEPN domain-containing protein [Eubacteriales bacterium]
MSRLLSRAKVALENAEHNYKLISKDDCFLDACCYNLQQAVELSLKFLVEMTGQQYAENHDIRANLKILNRVDYHVSNEAELRNKASTLYSWETESRYRESFVAVISDVEEVFALARALVDEAESKIRVETPG